MERAVAEERRCRKEIELNGAETERARTVTLRELTNFFLSLNGRFPASEIPRPGSGSASAALLGPLSAAGRPAPRAGMSCGLSERRSL